MANAEKVRTIDEDRLSMISRMSQAVSDVPKKDIQEVKALHSPPVGVVDTLVAVCILLGDGKVDWKEARKMLGDVTLLKKIMDVDPETIPVDRIKKAKELLSKYNEERIAKISKATVAFYKWACAVSEDC